MIYNENTVQGVYEANFREAQRQLQNLPIYCGCEPNFPGLAGWVFEQTIQHCIRRELAEMNLGAEIEEQVMSGEVKIDLLIGKTAIEVKTGPYFSEHDIVKCVNNQTKALENDWLYILLSLYKNAFWPGVIDALGKDNAVFLQNCNGEWKRFIRIIADRL
jgi:hypothetical protein